MRCPFCSEYRPPEAFTFVRFFTKRDRRLQEFCPQCAETLARAAERRATYSTLTFDQCLDRYIMAVKTAFDEVKEAS